MAIGHPNNRCSVDSISLQPNGHLGSIAETAAALRALVGSALDKALYMKWRTLGIMPLKVQRCLNNSVEGGVGGASLPCMLEVDAPTWPEMVWTGASQEVAAAKDREKEQSSIHVAIPTVACNGWEFTNDPASFISCTGWEVAPAWNWLFEGAGWAKLSNYGRIIKLDCQSMNGQSWTLYHFHIPSSSN